MIESEKNKKMKLVGLSGISGSGKTYIIRQIQSALKESVSVLSLDNYYKPIELQIKDENGIENFDLPEGIDSERLMKDIDRLQRGETIRFKVYNFNNPSKEEEFMEIKPAAVLIIEGIFVFHFKSVFMQLDYSIFLNASHNTVLRRRMERDTSERGISEEMVLYQWQYHALPGFEKFIEMHKQHVDIIIENEKDNGAALEKMTDMLKRLIAES